MHTDLFKEASKLWKQIPIGEAPSHNDFELRIDKIIRDIFHVGDYYYFIFQLKELYFHSVSSDIKTVLGYEPEDFSMPFFLSIIHPDDHELFLKFESKVIQFFGNMASERISNFKVRYDYRLRKKDGTYSRILQQYMVVDFNDDGDPLRTFVVHTDITHLKSEGKPVLAFIGLNGEPTFDNVDVAQQSLKPACSLTPREKEILLLLADGKGSKEIATELYISLETVHSHRKNILAKVGANNTAQLIRKATREGWV